MYHKPSPCAFISKIAVCNLKSLHIGETELRLDEFKILTFSGKLEIFNMASSTIIHDDGSMVFLDEVFECLPNVEKIEMLVICFYKITIFGIFLNVRDRTNQ